MFDCFCPLPTVWEEHEAAGSSENVPSETFPNQQPPLTVVTDGPVWALPLEMDAGKFLHHLHVGWVLCAVYLRWCAVLIGAIEAALLLVSMLTQSGWQYRLQWRPLRHVPEYWRMNFALVGSLLTIYSNLTAIAGVLMNHTDRQPCHLLPYIALNLLKLMAELPHLLAHQLTESPEKVTHRCWPMVLLLGFNLPIMMAVYFDVLPRSDSSSPTSASMLATVPAWIGDAQKMVGKMMVFLPKCLTSPMNG